ncbi:MAG: type II toxin-antitoxin system antitoxin, RelB/DinJ family, partial [Muricoprocola sp.]
IRMFLTQAVVNNGFPFEIKRVEHNLYAAMTEKMLLEKLEKSRISASQGNYRAADSVIADMREKYGL